MLEDSGPLRATAAGMTSRPLGRQAGEHQRLEEEKKRESRSFQVTQDVLRHLHVPDKLEILNIARYQLPATCPANPTQ